jgi:hypothetical protein
MSSHLSSVQISSSAPCFQTSTSKIIVSYILIFKFFDSNREDRSLWTEW